MVSMAEKYKGQGRQEEREEVARIALALKSYISQTANLSPLAQKPFSFFICLLNCKSLKWS